MTPKVDQEHRVLAVIGTRPEAIKMAPVIRALSSSAGVDTVVVLTGQHTTLVDQVLSAFDIETHYDLAIMRERQTLYDVAHGCLDGLRRVVAEVDPHVLLVQGDTATVFYAALVAFFEDVRVGHVEAGLRSGVKRSPFPEEVLRRMTDVIADYHFAPTAGARDNLLAEGIPDAGIVVTGNTVVDALLAVSDVEWPPENETLSRLLEQDRPFVLVTVHRRESFGEPIREIFRGIHEVADRTGVEVLYPVHPNPEVRIPADEILGDHPQVHLTDPLGYLDLVAALRGARLILTDSGGIQEEAPTFGTPVLVLRHVTERPEGIRAGVARLVGTDRERIVDEAIRLLEDEDAWRAMSTRENPYGDGRAGERIADVIVSSLTGRPRRTEDWKPAALSASTGP